MDMTLKLHERYKADIVKLNFAYDIINEFERLINT